MNESERELTFSKAMQSWEEGRLTDALSYMTELVDANQGGEPGVIGTFCALRAEIHKDLGDERAARRDFDFAIRMKPTSRLASAWYYNFLVESHKMSDANREGLRYLTAIESKLELTADTQSYVDTILGNLDVVPGWAKRLHVKEVEVINRRWQQLHRCRWEPG